MLPQDLLSTGNILEIIHIDYGFNGIWIGTIHFVLHTDKTI